MCKLFTMKVYLLLFIVIAHLPLAAQSQSFGSLPAGEAALIREEIHALQEKLLHLTDRLDAIMAADSSAPGTLDPAPAPVVSTAGIYGVPTHAAGQESAAGSLADAVRMGGYGSFRFEVNNIGAGPQIGDLPPIQRGFNGFDFRRFVLTLDASASSRLRFYSELEFERFNELEVGRTAVPENRGRRDRAGVRFIQEVEGQDGSEIAMEQAWAQYDFADGHGVRMGVVLPPVGRFNMNHDDDYWDLPRRTLVDRGGPVLPVKSAWRELGAGLVGNIPMGRAALDYQFYVVGGAKLDFTLEEVVSLRAGRNLLELEPEIAFSSGPFNGTDTADALSWRVGLSPALGSEFAFSGYHGKYTPGYLNMDSSINSLAFDGKTGWKGFEVEGEFVYTDFGRMHAVLTDMARQAVDSSAETPSSENATLESEVAGGFAGPFTNQRYGYWMDFKYRFWPRALNNTFLGRGFENPQLIPILRVERIWFNDFVREFSFQGGEITELQTEDQEQQRITLGMTYRPTPTVAMTAAYERNQRIQGSTLIFPQVLGLGGLPDDAYDAFLLGMSFGF